LGNSLATGFNRFSLPDTEFLFGGLFLAVPGETKLDALATRTFSGLPDDLARLGFAVAHALDPAAPPVPDLPEPMQPLVQEIAEALRAAQRPLIVSGTSLESERVMQAAANIAWALGAHAGLSFVVPEPRRDLCRRGWHAGQPRRPGTALFPSV
jgi:hypothetical protein